VFVTMRMLDRAGRNRARPEPEFDEETPRLRRRDLHPDAPVCRPISATRDFGEPAPPLRPAEPPVPTWLAEPAKPLEADDQPAPVLSAELEEPLELTERPRRPGLPNPSPRSPKPSHRSRCCRPCPPTPASTI